MLIARALGFERLCRRSSTRRRKCIFSRTGSTIPPNTAFILYHNPGGFASGIGKSALRGSHAIGPYPLGSLFIVRRARPRFYLSGVVDDCFALCGFHCPPCASLFLLHGQAEPASSRWLRPPSLSPGFLFSFLPPFCKCRSPPNGQHQRQARSGDGCMLLLGA
jgi:hypothetical protein